MSTTLPNMGLVKWNSTSDPFSHTQLAANIQALDDHDHTPGKGVQIPAGGLAANSITSTNLAPNSVLTTTIADLNVTGAKIAAGTVTNDKIATADLQKLGLSSSVVRRGKSIIPAEQTRTNATLGKLTTADEVANVVLPTEGLIFVAYQALWKCTDPIAASAAIFLNSTQLKETSSTAAYPLEDATTQGSNTNVYGPLTTCSVGLQNSIGASAPASDAVTGQILGIGSLSGGPCTIFADAGTYTVSVQFAAVTGTVSVKERKLWVWTMGF